MSRPLLEVHDLALSFGAVGALKGVSLSVAEGELLALIGPNGAGKTSLFNCVSGLYPQHTGRIALDGRPLDHLPPHRIAGLGVARTFQNLAVFPQLTALENLLLGCHHRHRAGWWRDLLGTPRARREEVAHRRRAEELLELLHLERYRDTPAAILPYGILKRLELGRALAMEPRLLLLDEPAAGLNREETEDMARYVLDLKEELGLTQILIEHELRFVMDLADRVVVLDFGRKLAEGTPTEVARDPAVVEAYLGGAEALA
jgi:branched-chain amino acid transport system ATP-binding protein